MKNYEITIKKLGNIKRAIYIEGHYNIYVADYPSSFKDSDIKQDILNKVQLRKGLGVIV